MIHGKMRNKSMNKRISSAVGALLVALAGTSALAADAVLVQGQSVGSTLKTRVVDACMAAFIGEIAPASDHDAIPSRVAPESRAGGWPVAVIPWRDRSIVAVYPYDLLLEARGKDGVVLARSTCVATRTAKVRALKTEVVDPVRLAQSTRADIRFFAGVR